MCLSWIVLSVIVRGTNSQAALAVILSMISIKLYQAYQVTAFMCVLNYFTYVSHLFISLKPYREYKDEMLSELAQYQILFTFFIALLLQASVFTSTWSLSLGHHHFVMIKWDEYYSNLIILYRHHHDSRESTIIAHILLLWIWPVPQDRQQRTDNLPTVWTTQYKWANIRFKYSWTWFWSKW